MGMSEGDKEESAKETVSDMGISDTVLFVSVTAKECTLIDS